LNLYIEHFKKVNMDTITANKSLATCERENISGVRVMDGED